MYLQNINFINSKTTFVTVNLSRTIFLSFPFSIQKQPLLLLILTQLDILEQSIKYSKTTFVTVNPFKLPVTVVIPSYSKTTFVTVNQKRQSN